MADGTQVQVHSVTEDTELHCWYDRESQAQSVYVELGLSDGILLASYNGIVGSGMPASVYHGIDRRWSIPPLTADGANKLLAEIAPLAQRVLDGSDVEWDGRNHVGRILTDDAQAAYDAISELCEAIEPEDDAVLQVWSMDTIGEGWTAEEAGITAATTDEELKQIEVRLTEEFRDGMGFSAVVIDGLDDYLRELRDDLAAQAAENEDDEDEDED
ncbi:hypothetical protein [Kitasatospora sp. NPDC090091]|uniref:hypothetical protein n=1 Tax=Kitasatospora sp. NPDC090091 TaxID=3364081 RepID=UPI003824FD7B